MARVYGCSLAAKYGDSASKLREIISLVQSHKANVKVILLPQGISMEQLPFGRRYEALFELFALRPVPGD
jgi:hypothetical protein